MDGRCLDGSLTLTERSLVRAFPIARNFRPSTNSQTSAIPSRSSSFRLVNAARAHFRQIVHWTLLFSRRFQSSHLTSSTSERLLPLDTINPVKTTTPKQRGKSHDDNRRIPEHSQSTICWAAAAWEGIAAVAIFEELSWKTGALPGPRPICSAQPARGV